MFISILVLTIFSYYLDYGLVVEAGVHYRQINTARLGGRWMYWGAIDWKMRGKSKLHCAMLCSQTAGCDVAEWQPADSSCNMYHKESLYMSSPLVSNTTTTILLGNTLDGKYVVQD